MRDDGTYCDATFNGEAAAAGIVVVENGRVVRIISTPITASSSHDAECAAIRMARDMFPGDTIFSDSASAATALSATWVPREANLHAHLAAVHGHTGHPDLMRYIERIVDRGIVFMRGRRRKYWVGRGCVCEPKRS